MPLLLGPLDGPNTLRPGPVRLAEERLGRIPEVSLEEPWAIGLRKCARGNRNRLTGGDRAKVPPSTRLLPSPFCSLDWLFALAAVRG